MSPLSGLFQVRSARLRVVFCRALALILAAGVAQGALAVSLSTGLSGRTLKDGGAGCAVGCHSASGAQDAITVTISGPTSLAPSQIGTYTVTADGPNVANVKMGINIAAADANALIIVGANLALAGTNDIVHFPSGGALNTTDALGVASYSFKYTMPSGAATSSSHLLYATSRLGLQGWAHDNSNHTVTTAAPFNALLGGSATPAPFALGQTGTLSNSGGAGGGVVSYSTSNSGICSISVTTLTAQGAGTCTITASKAADATTSAISDTFNLAVNQASQTITFGAQSTPRTFIASGTFAVSPVATGGASGNTVTYSSLTISICTVSSTTVTMVAAGTCTIAANQAGNTNYLAAAQATQSVVISQASQTITFGVQTSPLIFSNGGSFAISPLATGGASSSPVVYSSTTTGVCTVNGTTVAMVSAGVCTLAANQAGDTNFSAALQVTQDVTINGTVPGAPIIGSAVSGDTRTTIIFTAPASTGGSPITSYTVTCTPSGTGTNTASPIAVTGLTNTTTYTCSVHATNAIGNSAASGTVTVTPVKGSVLVPVIDLLFD